MKVSFMAVSLVAGIIWGSGCVSRTVISEPEYRGVARKKQALGTDRAAKTGEKKLLWIWQKDYHEGR